MRSIPSWFREVIDRLGLRRTGGSESAEAAFQATLALVAEGERLFAGERYDEALAAYGRAIEISRSLACGDHYAYELFLAAASNNAGMCLRKLRRLNEAERAFREAADICQRRWNVDADMIGDMYADVLESHAAVLSELGYFKEAIPVTISLVAHWRLSAKAAPATRTAGLAKALRRFAWVRAPFSIELDESLTAVTEALTIFQRLAEVSPATGEEEIKLTNSVLAAVLEKLGRCEEAAGIRDAGGIGGVPWAEPSRG